ncbi:MAG TPA: Flp pilus assembly protein CpaB [Longimicrobiales bacterium]|nr:Flp pilus assembly protein CpaB [Longimicrobiales bacterium]
MRTRRLLIILLLAVGTGSMAGYLALGQLQREAPPSVAALVNTGGKVRLAVAARDLPTGSLLAPEDVRLVDWPGEVLPLGYAGSVEELVGRGLLTDVRANEPLLSDRLASRDGGGGLPILIPEGMRAVSVRVDEVIQVAGFVTVGTRVDVMVTLDQNSTTTTRVILQNVPVLAAGQTVARDPEGKPYNVSVITLLVTPADAEKLTLAASEGRIQLALRSMLDMAPAATGGARLTGLLQGTAPASSGGPAARPVAPTRQDQNVVETIRGGVRTLNSFR